tara:strand:- start:19116 stop:19364 length:249 start_codon:yes stop_codon:yes gene_type:complete
MKADLEQLEKMQEDLFRQQCDLDIQKAMVKHFIKKKEDEILTLTDVVVPKETLPNNCKVCGRTIEEMGKMTSMCGVSACPNY